MLLSGRWIRRVDDSDFLYASDGRRGLEQAQGVDLGVVAKRWRRREAMAPSKDQAERSTIWPRPGLLAPVGAAAPPPSSTLATFCSA
jgi:hypothetical protein